MPLCERMCPVLKRVCGVLQMSEVAKARSHGAVYSRRDYDADVLNRIDTILANTKLQSSA